MAGNRGYQDNWQGVSAPLSGLAPDSEFSFEARLGISGSQTLQIVASGRETRTRLVGDWAHPGFAGSYLPDDRTIGDEGFEAEWRVPYGGDPAFRLYAVPSIRTSNH